ncbi:MAG: sigma-70 family RNA polymerase sigma factor [Lysobacterales bacterium]|nr:sigma-70 family RNA polymerase sigma factor [Xanthomonadales bacterium]MCB1610819.1 sigma-70 family RNA polymerase sigma factor [Xanthomonadales bacterium]
MAHTSDMPRLATQQTLRCDAAAERELAQRLRPGLRVLLRARLGSSPIVDDLVQEALILIIARWRQGEIVDPQQQVAFAHTTAVHLASNASRTEARRRRLASEYAHSVEAQFEPSPEDRMQHGQMLEAVRSIVDEMPNERDRQVLRAFYLDDLSKTDICEKLDLETRHFDRVLHRARVRLREFVSRLAESAGTSAAVATLFDSTKTKS